MFRTSRNFDMLLEKATSHLLMEPDWVSTLQMCDLIRQNDIQPKHALTALRKKLTSQNPHSALYGLLVLESMVKNCGIVIHEELTTKAFCDFLHELSKTTPHENVRSKLLELIQTWNFAFRKNPKHGALKDLMNTMKLEGHKFPVHKESDAMFSSDTAPEWADGDVCHRCRVQFGLVQRKHHCRACGQVFCGQCTSKTSTLPKFGIEKEVRVCDACYDEAQKPSSGVKSSTSSTESDLPEEYLKSSLAQQKQEPPKKSEEELREEEELQLALALSQSEAEAKEKQKTKPTSVTYNVKAEPVTNERPQTPPQREEETNPELARYLNRSYWESVQTSDHNDQVRATSPSAPATIPSQNIETKYKSRENGLAENDLEDFMKTLKSQVEIFINRMKSNSSRGRSIANDTSVQTLFMNITAMHSRLLHYIQEHDDSRIHYECLQDKLTQVKDARAALDALREEHNEKLRREAEEQERMRQMQMAHKLEVMRKKKQEYLQYQRQLALQRIQEQEREMQMRQEQQKQQYMIPTYGYMGSPVHGQPFPPNTAPPMGNYNAYPYPQHMMPPQSAPPGQMVPGGPQHGHLQQQPAHNTPLGPPPGFPQQGVTSNSSLPNNPQYGVPQQQVMGPGLQNTPSNQSVLPPQNQSGLPPQQQSIPQHPGGIPQNRGVMLPPQGVGQPQQGGMPLQHSGMPPQQGGMPPQQGGMPPQQGGMPPQQGGMPPQAAMPPQAQMLQNHQPGAPPASPQVTSNGEAQTAELISFD